MERLRGHGSVTRLLIALLGLQVALAVFTLAARDATAVAPALAIEWVRRLVAGGLLLLIGALAGRRIRPSRSDLADAVVPGLLGFGLGRGCVMVALSLTSATNVAVIDSAAPAVALVLAVLVGRERTTGLALAGSAAAFAGVGALVLAGRGLGAPAIPAIAPDPSAVAHVLDGRVLPVVVLGIAIGTVENAITFAGVGRLGAVVTAQFEYLVPCLTAVIGLALFAQPVVPVQGIAIVVVTGGLLVAGRGRRRDAPDEVLPGQPCCVA